MENKRRPSIADSFRIENIKGKIAFDVPRGFRQIFSDKLLHLNCDGIGGLKEGKGCTIEFLERTFLLIEQVLVPVAR